MKVRELIERLSVMDKDKIVIVSMPNRGFSHIELPIERECIVELPMDISLT